MSTSNWSCAKERGDKNYFWVQLQHLKKSILKGWSLNFSIFSFRHPKQHVLYYQWSTQWQVQYIVSAGCLSMLHYLLILFRSHHLLNPRSQKQLQNSDGRMLTPGISKKMLLVKNSWRYIHLSNICSYKFALFSTLIIFLHVSTLMLCLYMQVLADTSSSSSYFA